MPTLVLGEKIRIKHGLGTIGFRLRNGLYLDIFRKPYLGMFITTPIDGWKVWINFRAGTIRINLQEMGFRKEEEQQ